MVEGVVKNDILAPLISSAKNKIAVLLWQTCFGEVSHENTSKYQRTHYILDDRRFRVVSKIEGPYSTFTVAVLDAKIICSNGWQGEVLCASPAGERAASDHLI